MNHPDILIQLCRQLDLTSGATDIALLPYLQKAATFSVRNENFKIVKYQPKALQPVLETLANKEGTASHYFTPISLNITANFFPKTNIPDSRSLDAQLTKLKQAIQQAGSDADRIWLALEQHGSTLACDAMYPDISLYDFIKVTAGVALCLKQTENVDGELCIVSGNVSGIQTYLYDLVSKNAAKLLKGRSFYVQLLTDSLLQELLSSLDLSTYNVVYASGGGFYVLAPATQTMRQNFETYRQRVTAQLYKKHKTTLFAEFGISVNFGSTVLLDAVWEDLLIKMQRRRWKRLSSNPDLESGFYEFAEYGGTRSKDQITNIEIDASEEAVQYEDYIVSKMTHNQINAGRRLRDATWWISGKTGAVQTSADPVLEDPFEYRHFFEAEKPSLFTGEYRQRSFNKPEGSQAFIFYGGNKYQDETFDELAEGDRFSRLGVLRMDVDNLGTIFNERMETTYGLNLVRYAAVSRSLDWFFKGYLNTLQQQDKELWENTRLIYSGGDDLFIVGRWRETLLFAERIREEFKKWTCNNPNLNISGGISIVPGKFPIIQAAKMAERAEKQAKRYPNMANPTKNAFSLFDTPLQWDEEFAIVRSLKDELLPFMIQRKLNKSFLTKIGMHAAAQKEQQLNDKPQRWRWMLAYDMGRFKSTLPKDSEVLVFVNRVLIEAFGDKHYKNRLLKSNYPYLQLLHIACRWVELELRTLETENNNTHQ